MSLLRDFKSKLGFMADDKAQDKAVKVSFIEHKETLRAAIDAKLRDQPGVFSDPNGYTLVDGFFTPIIQSEVGPGASVQLSGTTLPLVAIIGNSNSIVHYFAARPLLPDVDFS